MTFSGRFLLNMIHFAARQGASAADLLAVAGHAQEELMEEKLRVEAPVYNAVLEAALSQVPDPFLGLHAGEYFNLGAAGIIAQITQTSTTMLEALHYCCEFSMLGCRAIPLKLEKTGTAYALRMKPDPVWHAQSPEAALHTLEGHLAFRACWDFSNRSANCTFSLILRPGNPHLAKAKLRFSGLV